MPTVEVNDELYSVLEARAEEKDFEDTEKYIEHLLKQVVEKIKKEKESSDFSEEDEEEVKKKLKGLGYMD